MGQMANSLALWPPPLTGCAAHGQDMNPIENAWALLDHRLESTAPGGFETEKAFKERVRVALRWLNTSKLDALKRLVTSMQSRVEAVLEGNGAMTKY